MKIFYTIFQRMLYLVPTLLGLIILTFFIAYYVPANPAAAAAGPFADKETIAKIAEKYGFDKPIPVQLWRYLKRLAVGDLGESLYSHRDISQEILSRLPATLELVLCGLLLSIAVGIPIGVISAVQRNSLFDHLLRAITIAGVALATFWIGIEFQLLFGYQAGIFPIAGRFKGVVPDRITGFFILDSILNWDGQALLSTIRHLVLPTITLSVGPCATIVRFTRAGVLNALNSDYVLYERGMGLPHRMLIYKYVLRNAVTSTTAQIGLLFGFMLAGSFVVELVFSWPGVGAFAVESILMMDYNAVLGVAIWTAIAYSLGNLIADTLLILIDPREVAS
jgi:ABC-type dipeptide/oligopeptide/nickel transport system permease component